MRAPFIIALCFMFGTIGFVGGAYAQAVKDQAEIEEAWSDITVVKDGTLVANPAYYAWHPEELADTQSAHFINNRKAAIDVAMSEHIAHLD